MKPFPFVLISLMDAWDVMFGCSTQHSMDQLKVHIMMSKVTRSQHVQLAFPSSDGNDYNSVSGEFIFSSGSTDRDSECADVGIINDDVLETTEFFTFVLFSNDSAVGLLAPVADVYIDDEDG